MPDTLAQAIDYGRDVAKDNAIIKSTEHDRRRKFEQAVENQHMLAVRTAEEMKKLVLVGTKGSRMTELDDFAKGQCAFFWAIHSLYILKKKWHFTLSSRRQISLCQIGRCIPKGRVLM